MSVVIDAATKAHQKQVTAVTRSQEVIASALEKLSSTVGDLQGKVPAVPEAISGPAKTVTEPLTKLVGTREEVAAYVAQSVRDWTQVQQQVQAKVIDRVAAKA